jgi:hypothetical protein
VKGSAEPRKKRDRCLRANGIAARALASNAAKRAGIGVSEERTRRRRRPQPELRPLVPERAGLPLDVSFARGQGTSRGRSKGASRRAADQS